MEENKIIETDGTHHLEFCRKLLEANPYIVYNRIEVASATPESVEIYTDLRPEFTNIYGMLHGGLMATMLDSCAGLTVRLDGKRYVTLDMNISYLANVKEGRVTARSRVVRRGNNVTVMRVELTGGDTLLAEATVTFYRIG